MAKPDIRHAFYIIPVHPLTIDLLGFQKKKLFYHATGIPRGEMGSCH